MKFTNFFYGSSLLFFVKTIYCQQPINNCTGGVQALCNKFMELTSPINLDQCNCGDNNNVVSCISGNTESCDESSKLYSKCHDFCISAYDINDNLYTGLKCYKVSFPMSIETYCTMQEDNGICTDLC